MNVDTNTMDLLSIEWEIGFYVHRNVFYENIVQKVDESIFFFYAPRVILSGTGIRLVCKYVDCEWVCGFFL